MYSFDIFDTLLTRDVASPKGIFACMQEALRAGRVPDVERLPAYVRNNFYELRIHAEEIARITYQNKGYEDILLPRIYEAFALLGNLDREQIVSLMALENRMEIGHSVGIRENIIYLHRLLDEGEKVVLISDMYLEESVIRRMLVKADAVFGHLPLYVSGQWNKTKYSGSLYDLVRERELPEGQDWIHIGDNPFSDEKQALAGGIQPKLYTGEALTLWEQRAAEKYQAQAGVQARIGISRLARRKSAEEGTALSAAYRIGSSVGGNVLVPYIYWILQVSRQKGIRRLYFIARDGYLLKQVADILIGSYQLNIETKYIYGSRKAWRVPAVSERFHDIYKLIEWSHPRMIDSVEKLAAVFGLEAEEMYPFLPEGCRAEGLELSEYAVKELAVLLDGNQDFLEFLTRKNAQKRQLLRRYLLQELDLSDADFAFVDLSGGGLSQGCLAEVMKDVTDAQVRFFYFRLNQMGLVDNCISYVFVPGRLPGSLIVEMMCRAPHGQTEGYERKTDGKVEPVLAQGETESLLRHGYMDFAAGVSAYAGEYCRVTADLEDGNDLTLLLHYLKEIVETPDGEILDFFAGMPNNVTGRERKAIEYAPHLSREELKGIYLLRSGEEALEKYYPYSSLEYSLLRCTQEEKEYIAYCKAHYNDEIWVREREKRSAVRAQYGRASRFPCELLRGRVVLYGAGKYGCDLYRKIQDWPCSEVVLWVDRDVREREIGDAFLKVVSPEQIGGTDFQQVVIAVMDSQAAYEIRKDLEGRGVAGERILWQPPMWRPVDWRRSLSKEE